MSGFTAGSKNTLSGIDLLRIQYSHRSAIPRPYLRVKLVQGHFTLDSLALSEDA
jgi:hypothetical protein